MPRRAPHACSVGSPLGLVSALVERVVALVERVEAAVAVVVQVVVGVVAHLGLVLVEDLVDALDDLRDGLILTAADDGFTIRPPVHGALDTDGHCLATESGVDTDAVVPRVQEDPDMHELGQEERHPRVEPSLGTTRRVPEGLVNGIDLPPGNPPEVVGRKFLSIGEGRTVGASVFEYGRDGGRCCESCTDDPLEEFIEGRVDRDCHDAVPCEVGTVARTSSKEHHRMFRYRRKR